MDEKQFKPYIAADEDTPEFTLRAVLLGIFLALILGAANVIRGREVTTIPKCRFDAEVCGAVYRTDPVVRCGNLICARGKKDMSEWMKQFTRMIEEHIASGQ